MKNSCTTSPESGIVSSTFFPCTFESTPKSMYISFELLRRAAGHGGARKSPTIVIVIQFA